MVMGKEMVPFSHLEVFQPTERGIYAASTADRHWTRNISELPRFGSEAA
jgi:hypothetical protein